MEVPAAEEHEMCTPSPIAPLGVQITEAPMSPLRVWQALQGAASRSRD